MFGGDFGLTFPTDVWEYRAGWTEICSACASAFRPGSHATFDAADGYVVFIGGNQMAKGSTVAWVASITLHSTAPPTADVGMTEAFHVTVNGGIPPLRYLWTFGDGNVSTNPSPVERFPVAGTFHPTVVVTDSTGISATLTLTVVIDASLSVSIGSTPSATDSNRSVAFLSDVLGGTAPFTLSWSFGDGAVSNLSAPSHAYSAPGSYLVSVTVEDAAGAHASKEITEQVNYGPVPTLLASRSITDPGVPVNFSASTSNGTAPYTYFWALGDGTNASGPSVSHAFGAPGVDIVRVTVTDAVGSVQNTSVAVLVDPPLQANLVGPTSADVGENLTYLGGASGGTGAISYAWNLGDNSSAATQNVTHPYLHPGNYSVTVRATDSLGSSANASVVVTVRPDPTVTLSAGQNDSVLPGENETFGSTPSGGTGPYSFLWIFGDGNSSSGQNASHAFAVAGQYHVELVVTDSFGVTATAWVTITVSSPVGPARRRID
jgi:PKD repeat protein